MSKFTLFGCWNLGKCEQNIKPTPFTRVMNRLKYDSFHPDIYVVAGDNMYPEKATKATKKKIKTYNMENMVSGFDCLNQLNKPTYVLLGNHDIEYNIYNDSDQILVPDAPPHEPCIIYNRQKEFTDSHEQFRFPDISKHLTLHHHFVTENVLLLMIDSNIYDPDYVEESRAGSSCYNDTIEVLREGQRAEISKILKSGSWNDIYIVMHHPIVTIKHKKETTKVIVLDESILELFRMICEKKKTPEYLHVFTADYHTFLDASFKINVTGDVVYHQHIVGTGGAELDTEYIPRVFENEYQGENGMQISQFIAHDSRKESYGYLNCVIQENGVLNYEFIDAATPTSDTISALTDYTLSAPISNRHSQTSASSSFVTRRRRVRGSLSAVIKRRTRNKKKKNSNTRNNK